MAKEYIDRESLYKFLSEQAEPITGAYSRGRNDGLNIAKSAVHNRQITPAADVAPVVHGKWIRTDYDEAEWLCMNCKEGIGLADGMVDPIKDAKLHYCPNCGAKMEVGTEDG